MEEYFYDRTRNLKDIDYVGLTGFCPSYGFQANFSSQNSRLDFQDGYFTNTPKGVNSVKLNFFVSYEVDEAGAQKIVNYLESLSGVQSFVFDTENIVYKDLSGYCDGYSVDHLSQERYRVNTSISIDESPSLLNWKNTNFIEHQYKEWKPGENYELDDIVYTGVSNSSWDNFYYCTGDHLSEQSNSPTGVNTAWTQSFYWEPDAGMKTDVAFAVSRFDGSFNQRLKTSKNIAKVPLNYNFSSISKKQLLSMLHFLELKGGYRRFRHQIPTVFNRPKVYICEQWSHVWNSPDSHDLSVVFTEDALGVIPREVGVGGSIPSTLPPILSLTQVQDNVSLEAESTDPVNDPLT